VSSVEIEVGEENEILHIHQTTPDGEHVRTICAVAFRLDGEPWLSLMEYLDDGPEAEPETVMSMPGDAWAATFEAFTRWLSRDT
jgi:hypothetical protein